MKASKKVSRMRQFGRIVIGLAIGAGAGYLASTIAGSSGSQCMILCNQAVAIPYFAAMGGLIAWR
jgi:hypothetical protein